MSFKLYIKLFYFTGTGILCWIKDVFFATNI